MFFRGVPELTGAVTICADGVPGTMQTLREMRRLVNAGRVNPQIRAVAINLTQLQPERSTLHEVAVLFEFVRDSIRYVGDVNDVETLTTPEKTLALRAGDCDDKSVLLASLLESIGYQTKFIVSSYLSPLVYEHVFVGVDCDGMLISLDPTEGGGVGHEPDAPLLRYVEGN